MDPLDFRVLLLGAGFHPTMVAWRQRPGAKPELGRLSC